jgi:SAM-dependent methyltransferase
VNESPGDGTLEIGFEMASRGILTRLTVPRPSGEEAELSRRGMVLPYRDGAFTRVVCPRGLQLLPDRSAALVEMRRVLAHGGEIVVAVPGSIEHNPPFGKLADSLERRAGARRAAAVRWLFNMSDPDDLRWVLADAGFEEIRIDVVRTTGPPAPSDEVGGSIGTETIRGRARRL